MRTRVLAPTLAVIALVCPGAAGAGAAFGGDAGGRVRVARARTEIIGVVRAVRSVDGVRHATISVGTADGVTKGMRFVVTDPSDGKVLGSLTVDAGEDNQATGPMDGPHVKDIRLGHQVSATIPG